MSITNLSRGADDFRAAAGLASWSPDTLDLTPEAPALRGPDGPETGAEPETGG